MRAWPWVIVLLAATSAGQEVAAPGGRIEDADGNFRLELPSGWFVIGKIPDNPRAVLRFHAQRLASAEGQQGRLCAELQVWRFVSTSVETFTNRTPSDQLDRIDKSRSTWIARYFGEGSRGTMRSDVDGSVQLGGAETSAGFTYRGRTIKEDGKIREAEDLIRRGEKGVTLPEFPERELRGRIALLSPGIYVARVCLFPGFADDEALRAEVTTLLDSFEFINDKPFPPPLSYGGKRYGDTLKDPANATEREVRAVVSESARKTYRLAVECTVPPGMEVVPEKQRGKGVSVVLIGQDDQNNWVKVDITHASLLAIGDRNKAVKDPRTAIESWRSNWEAKAKGARFPTKPDKNVRFGPFKGKGYKNLGGKVGPFAGSFRCAVTDKSNWRTRVSVETRGEGEKIFRTQLKQFFKSLKVDYKVD